MAWLLKLAELIVGLLLVAWTLVFPLATLLSLMVTIPLAALAMRPVTLRSRR